MKIYTVIFYMFILSGCSTVSTKDKQEVIVNNKTKTATLYPSDYDMSSCDKFSQIIDGGFDEIVELRKTDAKALQNCSDKQKALTNFIRELITEDLK